jgi:hypothetical protein
MASPAPPSPSNRPAEGAKSAWDSQSLPIQIPGIILEFLNRATVAALGTRDRNLVPHLHRVSGWRIEPDREVMAVSIPGSFTRHLQESLEDNGQVSMTIEEIGPHETYQFKGTFVDLHPCTAADRQIADRIRERFAKVVPAQIGATEAACRAFGMDPDVTLRFRVREIYVQTPGPGAGRRLVPQEER